MQVVVEKTVFLGNQQIDINYLYLQLYRQPLIIATREGQIERITQWVVDNNVENITIIGWWELHDYNFFKDGFYDYEAWKHYDVVFFLDPSRAGDTPEHRITYQSIIDTVRAI